MKLKPAKLVLALASAVVLTLAGCGGGGTSTPTTPDVPAVVTITGVAATGAAFVDAVVTVIDKTGTVVGTSGTVGADGTYSVTIAAGAQAPFVLIASRTTADGEVQSLVSVIDSAATTTANVTPITNLIASLLSPSGDPSKLAEELAAGTASITPESVAATVTEVKTILATLLDATGTTGTDPLTGTFAVDGTGYDRLLDSISINIVPSSDTSSNIEIAVKQALPDGTQPATTSFTSDATTIDPLPPITGTLVEEGTSVKIANLLAELTACYALPVTERVNGAADNDEPNMYVGTAANVVAPACKAVFFGNDPASFMNNGGYVGRTEDNRGAFASLFRGGATGLVFSQGTYEFTRGNGDLVVGYKTRATDTSETFDTFVVKKDTDNKLRLIGNQYLYPGSAASFHQRRNFITLGQQDWTYYSTGYTLDVTDLKSGGGVSIFNRVVVTTPNDTQVVLRPSSGSSFLVISKNDDPASATLPSGAQLTGSNFIRLRSEYADGSTTRPHPREVETNNIVFAQTDRTEAQLASTPSLGSWKFEYYLAADPSAAPVVQYRKNRARALNIAELRTQGLATLTSGLITEVQSGAQTSVESYPGQILFVAGDTAAVETEGGGDGWSVLSGQLPPTSITVFGNFGTSNSFNDNTGVRSTLRKATVPCTQNNNTVQQQCLNNGNGTYGPAYAAGTRLTGLQLWARDAVGREFGNFYAMYKLTLPTP